MRNIYESYRGFAFGKIFFPIVFLFFCVCANALNVDEPERYNGSCTITEIGQGRYILSCTNYNGQIRLTNAAINFDRVSVDSDLKFWRDGSELRIQPINQLYGDKSYCIWFDQYSGAVMVFQGQCGISMEVSDIEVCPGGSSVLSVGSISQGDRLMWGILTQSDTTWLSQFNNQTSISVTVNEPTTYVVKHIPANGFTSIDVKEITLSYSKCGYVVKSDLNTTCPGQSVTLSTDYENGSSYIWKDQSGLTIATTTVPNVVVAPKSTTTYSLYVDGLFVGSTTIQIGNCDFYITSYYPTTTCLQDSNYLSAIGIASLEDIENPVYKWESSLDNVNWKIEAENSLAILKVAPSENTYYRATYKNQVTPSFFFEVPDCSKNENCNGLQSRVLFYETFGYFVDEHTYISSSGIYRNTMTLPNTVSAISKNNYQVIGRAGNTRWENSDYMDRIHTESAFYSAKEENAFLSYQDTGYTQYHIAKYVAPDPNGYVVPATKFIRVVEEEGKLSNSNQFVGTDGHLFLHSNPMFPYYSKWSDVNDYSYRLQDGYYAIVANPDSTDQHSHRDYLDCTDATGNTNGAMLFVNSGETSISHSAIYAQRVDLACAADRFSFTMNVRNATKKEFNEEGVPMNPVNISVLLLEDIDGSSVLPISYKTMDNISAENVLSREINSGDLPSASTEWKHIEEYVELKPGEKVQSLWVVLYNNGKTGDGNDMLIDDISFSVCLPKAELAANIDGQLITDEVVVCDGRDVELVASQKGDYIKNPYYLFQYYDKTLSEWKDMLDYESDLTYKQTSVKISVTDKRFSGDVNYRVIIGSSISGLRIVAENPEDVCNEFLVAESDISVRNMYGGPMCPDTDFPYCFIEGDTVTIEGCRNLMDPNHEWKMYWKNFNNVMFVDTMEVKGVSSDKLYLVIGKNGVVSVFDRDMKKMLDTDLDGISSISYVGKDQGGCEHKQTFTLIQKPIVDLVFDASGVSGCDSIMVKVSNNVHKAKLNWDWSVPGKVVVIDDSTQVFYPDGLDTKASISGVLKISVANKDSFCSPSKPWEIPYTVYNASYSLKVTPSTNPVCVTPGQADETILMTLTATVTPSEADLNITAYNWRLTFSNGDVVDTTTYEKVLTLKYKNLYNHTGMTLNAKLLSSVTKACGTIVNDDALSDANVEIREGNFTLSLTSNNPNICLKTDDEIVLSAVVTPASALSNLTSLQLYDDDKEYEDSIFTNAVDNVYTVTISKTDYPEFFKPGTIKYFYVSSFDKHCSAQSVSQKLPVNLNGFEFSLSDKNGDKHECLAPGEKLPITATLSDPNAQKLIKKYEWYMDDQLVGGDGLTYNFTVEKSGVYEFKLKLSDGICEDVVDSIEVEVGVNEPPVIDCDSLKAHPIERVLNGRCEIPFDEMNLSYPIAVDGCSKESIEGVGKRTSGLDMKDKYYVGRDTIIWSFTSKYSTTIVTCEQYVYIQGDSEPRINCDSLKANPIERVVHGKCELSSAEMNISTPIAYDYCTNDPVPGVGRRTSGREMSDPYYVGYDTIVWTFKSEYSIAPAICEQYVFVQSDMEPKFDCESLKDTSLYLTMEQCYLPAGVLVLPNQFAKDACLDYDVAGVPTRSDGRGLDESYPRGTTVITWTFKSPFSVTPKICQQKVMVMDTIPPHFPCESLHNVFAQVGELSPAEDSVSYQELVTAGLVIPSYDDYCDGTIIGVPTRSDGKTLEENYYVGFTTITWTFTDSVGNSSQCSQIIEVDNWKDQYLICPKDLDGRTFACIEDIPAPYKNYIEFKNGGGQFSNEANFDLSTFTYKDVSNNDSCNTVVTRTYTVKDVRNNDISCTQVIQVKDTIAPLFSINLKDTILGCKDEIFDIIPVTISDNCDPNPTLTISEVNHRGTDSTQCDYYNYDIVRTYEAVDRCGNKNVMVQTLMVRDTVPPHFNQPEDWDSYTLADLVGQCEFLAPNLFDKIKNNLYDDCTGTFGIRAEQVPAPGTPLEQSTYVTVYIYDLCGNVDSLTKFVKVQHKEVIVTLTTYDLDSCVTDEVGLNLTSQSVRQAQGTIEYIDDFDGAIYSTKGTFVYDYYRGTSVSRENLMFSNNQKTYWPEFEKLLKKNTSTDSLVNIYATLHQRSESGYYTIVAMDTLSGCSDTSTFTIRVKERPKVVLQSLELPVCEGSVVDLTPYVACIDSMGSDSLTTYWKKDGLPYNPSVDLITYEDNGKSLVFFAENECGVTSSLNSHLSFCNEDILNHEDSLYYFNNDISKYELLVNNKLFSRDSILLKVNKRYNPEELTITTNPNNPSRIWVGETVMLSVNATYGYDYLIWYRVVGDYDLRDYDAMTATSQFVFDDPNDEQDLALGLYQFNENATIIDMPADTSYYYVTVTNGVCPAVPSALAKVNVIPHVPTAFTPHTKDGLNDVFMERHHIVIYDRYGAKVFEGDNGWDGTFGNRMADPGVYYHQVQMTDGSVENGTIEIIKVE